MVRDRALRRPPLCERRGIALSLIQRCDSCIRTGTGVRRPRVESLRTSKSRASVLFAATSVGEPHAFGRISGPRFRACRVLKENYVANIYIKYRDRLERLLGEFAEVQPAEPIVLDQTDLAALPSTIGGQVLASRPGANFQALFTNFNLLTNGFTWDPTAKGSFTVAKTLETLDGTRTSGECKVLAAALLGLWVFPPPLGLGQSRSTPKASLYRFENYSDDGFISHHPPSISTRAAGRGRIGPSVESSSRAGLPPGR